eukprot:458069-Prorocentrum_lima.AAC.1
MGPDLGKTSGGTPELLRALLPLGQSPWSCRMAGRTFPKGIPPAGELGTPHRGAPSSLNSPSGFYPTQRQT